MHGRHVGLLIGLSVAGACAAPPPPQPQPAVTTAATCPGHVVEAEAWINRMPGAGASPRQLVVSARMANAAATALLLRSDASTAQQLVLDIRGAAAAPVPGRLGYREPAPESPYSSVLLRCHGAPDFTISEITAVY